jgi:hypothetical protein
MFELRRIRIPPSPQVVVSIEDTALHDAYLQQKTISELSNEAAGERVFSLRNEFPDAWYDLHKSADPALSAAEFGVVTPERRRRDRRARTTPKTASAMPKEVG